MTPAAISPSPSLPFGRGTWNWGASATSQRAFFFRVDPLNNSFERESFFEFDGGEVFADPVLTTALVEQVGILHQVGIRTVLIHGGGPQSTELATALGLDTTFVDGRRVTDA